MFPGKILAKFNPSIGLHLVPDSNAGTLATTKPIKVPYISSICNSLYKFIIVSGPSYSSPCTPPETTSTGPFFLPLITSNVKFIGDPSERIKEDYLRIIRFIRFSLQYKHNFLESSTIEAIKLNLNGIKNLSKERILKELLKIIKLSNFKNILKNEDLKSIFSIIFPEFKNLNRIIKLDLIPNSDLISLDTNTILATLLIDESSNHEYFCHKYKVSNQIKENLDSLSKNLKEYKSDKNFFKKNLKKNIYFLGKKRIKDFALFVFFENKKWSYQELKNLKTNIEKISIPKFSI